MRIVALLLLVVLTSGCAAPDGEGSETTPRDSSWAPAATPAQLHCEDGLVGPTPLTDQMKLTDTVGAALRGERSELPRAHDVGIPAPSEDWYFRKAPLFVSPGTPTVTLRVPGDGSQYLLWTSDDAWTDSDSDGISGAWAATELSVTACHDLTTSYFGGLLVHDPAHCFPLEVRQDDHTEVRTIRGDGGACA